MLRPRPATWWQLSARSSGRCAGRRPARQTRTVACSTAPVDRRDRTISIRADTHRRGQEDDCRRFLVFPGRADPALARRPPRHRALPGRSYFQFWWQTEGMSALPVVQPADPDLATEPGQEPCVLLKLGEIVLKGRNRQQFERLLHENIRRAVRDIGVQVRVWQRESAIVVRAPGAAAGG